mgnify:FL=1
MVKVKYVLNYLEKFILIYTFITMKITKKNNPYPIKLGEKKTILQQQASENDRSLHWWINKILEIHIREGKKVIS